MRKFLRDNASSDLYDASDNFLQKKLRDREKSHLISATCSIAKCAICSIRPIQIVHKQVSRMFELITIMPSQVYTSSSSAGRSYKKLIQSLFTAVSLVQMKNVQTLPVQ